MRKQLMKGNEAIVRSAILAGCRAFYGYPITPASEIAEAAALYMPRAGGVFLQENAAWRPSFAASFNCWCSMALGLLSLKTR